MSTIKSKRFRRVLVALAFVVITLLGFGIWRLPEFARQANDRGNLKSIGLALRMYSGENEGWFPDNLAGICEQQFLTALSCYVVPGSGTPAPQSAQELRNGQTDYVYFGGRNGLESEYTAPANAITVHTKPGIYANYVSVLFVDGRVEGVKTRDLRRTALTEGWILPNKSGKL